VSHEQVQAALRELEAGGCAGMILDLRWCPGGFLTQARAIAHCFLAEESVLARAKYRHRKDAIDEADEPVEHFLDLPILVLINGETSGGGELIAAALQDNRRAAIAGDRTIGKATVQKSLELT